MCPIASGARKGACNRLDHAIERLVGPEDALPVNSRTRRTLPNRDVLEEALVNRYIAVLLAVLLFAAGSSTPAFAGTTAEKDAKFAAKVREGISGLMNRRQCE
jgi:hypothetical protein